MGNITEIILLTIGASFVQRTTGFGFGIFIMTLLPSHALIWGSHYLVRSSGAYDICNNIIKDEALCYMEETDSHSSYIHCRISSFYLHAGADP